MKPSLRCAIYTRVSTEHGLEQEFNSLDNQREAAEAYVKSQAHEGWCCLGTRFDDGGFSGGSLDRPALTRLLDEIKSRRIDVIVVYKVDRLTRSLADFAKLVELFDAHGVSFVSVTQAFNTTSSMGRLTLNVLLSFAQFEREVTGERIRDKIAASKAKGIWMGGVVPLGYRVENRALHIVEEHAALIRSIYERYLRLGSIVQLKEELDRAKVTLPVRLNGKGERMGGCSFSRGQLTTILSSPVYAGQIKHKGHIHIGQHSPIIEPLLWDEVQAMLTANAQKHRHHGNSVEHLLAGRIKDEQERPLSPTHTAKGARRYRYYVTAGERQREVKRIAAIEIEMLVVDTIRDATGSALAPAALVGAHLRQLTIRSDAIEIELTDDRQIQLAWMQGSSRRRREIVLPKDAPSDLRPMKSEDRARILKAIAQGRAWLDELTGELIASPDAIAEREKLTERSIRNILALAFLSPRIVTAIIEGRLPRGIGIARLAGLPVLWTDQHQALGL